MSEQKVTAEEALERARLIAARLSGADTSGATETAVSSSEGSSRKRSRWGLTADDSSSTQDPREMARLVAAKLSSTATSKPKETAGEEAIQKRIWIKTTRERPPRHFKLFLQDKLSYPGVTVELQGRGSSDKPPLPGVPEQPLHIIISGKDKSQIDQVDISLDVLLRQAENEPPLVPPEDPDAIVDQSRALSLVGTASSSSYRPASVAQMIGQANMPTFADGDWIDEDVKVPNGVVGFIIGRGGENIASMQARTGAKVQIQKEHELQPGQTQRTITLSAPNQQAIDECREIIMKMVREKASSLGVSLNKDERLMKEALEAGHALVTVKVPDLDVGLVIGKGGATIKAIQEQTGANIQVPPSADSNDSSKRTISITHPDKAGALAAKERIESLLKNMPSYGTSEEQITIHVQIPDNEVGLCIGRQGCVIREMQAKSGTRIQIPSHPTPGETYRIATISGSKKGCETVKQMIASIIEAQSSAPVMSGTFQSYGSGRQEEEQYSAEWAAYHAAQAAAQEQYAQSQQQQQQLYPTQQHFSQQTTSVPTAPAQQQLAPDAYYEEFFRYSYYYGEDAARRHYGAWAPPPGTPNPYGVNPNGIQTAPIASAPSPAPATANQQAVPEARETSKRNVSNLPAWMTK